MRLDLADALIRTLPTSAAGLHNPWAQTCPHETPENGTQQRIERLARHLDCDPMAILVGEAPGYQGCRYSGVAFTSERLLIEGAIPRIAPLSHRLSRRARPFSEPSATIVWRTLYEQGVAERTILWNAVQLHPHKPNEPWSNRTPTTDELAYGAEALQILRQAYPNALVIAVGNKARDALNEQGIIPHACVRHPANGGATLFADGLKNALNGKP